MKTWFNGQLKEGDVVICLKKCKDQCKPNGIAPKGAQYEVVNGCIQLDRLDMVFTLKNRMLVWGYMDDPMPTAEWFFDHFAVCR